MSIAIFKQTQLLVSYFADLLVCISNNLYAHYVSDRYPPEAICDRSLCTALEGPNVELLQDWLFCHPNHSHNDDAEVQVGHAHFPLPDALLDATAADSAVLTHIDQVAYLLTAVDSPKILLESITNMAKSIYLQLDRGYFLLLLLFLLIMYFLFIVFLYSNVFSIELTNRPKTHRTSEWENIESDSSDDVKDEALVVSKCLVRYIIFNESTFPPTQTKIIQGPLKQQQLNNLRMSFEVEWFRMTEQLFDSLVQHLTESNVCLTRMQTNFDTFIITATDKLDSPDDFDSTFPRSLALLNRYSRC